MNKYIQKKLAMYNVVRQLMEQNEPTWNSIPAVEGVFSNFNAKLSELNELAIKQSSKLAGFAKSKSKLKAITIDQTLVISGALTVYADTINDEILMEKANLKASVIRRFGKEQLLTTVEEIIQLSSELATELEPFGISSAHIDALNTNFENLKGQVYAVRMEIIKRKQLTQAVTNISKETDRILTTGLDKLMRVLKTVDEKFYEKYKSARMIVDYGTKHKLPPNDLGQPNGFLGA